MEFILPIRTHITEKAVEIDGITPEIKVLRRRILQHLEDQHYQVQSWADVPNFYSQLFPNRNIDEVLIQNTFSAEFSTLLDGARTSFFSGHEPRNPPQPEGDYWKFSDTEKAEYSQKFAVYKQKLDAIDATRQNFSDWYLDVFHTEAVDWFNDFMADFPAPYAFHVGNHGNFSADNLPRNEDWPAFLPPNAHLNGHFYFGFSQTTNILHLDLENRPYLPVFLFSDFNPVFKAFTQRYLAKRKNQNTCFYTPYGPDLALNVDSLFCNEKTHKAYQFIDLCDAMIDFWTGRIVFSDYLCDKGKQMYLQGLKNCEKQLKFSN